MTSMNFLIRRSLATAATVGAVLLMAGCGSSSSGSGANKATGAAGSKTATGSQTSTTGSTSTSAAASPPPSGSALEAGLVKNMAHNQPMLSNVKPHCPSKQAKRYPVTCHFTATEVVKKFKKTYHMAGTITVAGAEGTHYEYGLNYAPTK